MWLSVVHERSYSSQESTQATFHQKACQQTYTALRKGHVVTDISLHLDRVKTSLPCCSGMFYSSEVCFKALIWLAGLGLI